MPGQLIATYSGLDDIDRAMNALGEPLKRDTVIRAMLKASRPTVLAAKARIHSTPRRKGIKKKHLRSAMRVQAMPEAVRGLYAVSIGAKAPHAHLVEFGHANVTGKVTRAESSSRRRRRIVKDTRRATGTRTPPHPFLRPAWDTTSREVIDGFVAEIRLEFERTMGKLRARADSGALTARDVRSLGSAP